MNATNSKINEFPVQPIKATKCKNNGFSVQPIKATKRRMNFKYNQLSLSSSTVRNVLNFTLALPFLVKIFLTVHSHFFFSGHDSCRKVHDYASFALPSYTIRAVPRIFCQWGQTPHTFSFSGGNCPLLGTAVTVHELQVLCWSTPRIPNKNTQERTFLGFIAFSIYNIFMYICIPNSNLIIYLSFRQVVNCSLLSIKIQFLEFPVFTVPIIHFLYPPG